MKTPSAVVNLVIFVLTMITFAFPATAEVLYDNGAPGTQYAIQSDFDPTDLGNIVEAADDFVVGGAVVLQDVHWWGLYALADSPQVDDFTIRLFEDAGGAPAATAFYQTTGITGNRVPTGDLFSTHTIYEYNADITPVALVGGTTYWISIVNNTTYESEVSWFWLASAPGNAHGRLNGGAWQTATFQQDLAFQLTGTVVPEPASLTLFGLGLVGLLLRKRRS